MNFTGVSWYILSSTHSTVKVSLQVIVVTLPGCLCRFFSGGVLIDRLDRRYLGVLLDLARGIAVLAAAFIAWRGAPGALAPVCDDAHHGHGLGDVLGHGDALVQEVNPTNVARERMPCLTAVATACCSRLRLIGFTSCTSASPWPQYIAEPVPVMSVIAYRCQSSRCPRQAMNAAASTAIPRARSSSTPR